MCISNSTMKSVTTKRKYIAYRILSLLDDPYRIAAAFRTVHRNTWRTRTRRVHPGEKARIGQSVSVGLHSLRSLKALLRTYCYGFALNNRVAAKVRVSGKTAVCVRGQRTVGYLSERQQLLELYVPRARADAVEGLRKRYKVPVRTLSVSVQ